MSRNVTRRAFVQTSIATAAALPFGSARAEKLYPTRPVRLIVPFTAGSGTDVWGRLFAQWLSERLGQQFYVENRAGAGGNIATEAVVKSPADGYTLLKMTSANSWNVALYDNLSFDFIRDLAPIASTSHGYGVVVVHPSFPAKTLAEFIAYAKANPGKINIASGGAGSGQHVWGELFKAMAGVDMLHVPYRGPAQARTDLLGGQVPVMFDTVSTALEHIRTEKLRALAVTSATRIDLLPDVPAVAEFVPGYEAGAWVGFAAPRNTPTEIIAKLNREINTAIAGPKFKTLAHDLGSVLVPMSPSEFGGFIGDYTDKWTRVIRGAGIKAS